MILMSSGLMASTFDTAGLETIVADTDNGVVRGPLEKESDELVMELNGAVGGLVAMAIASAGAVVVRVLLGLVVLLITVLELDIGTCNVSSSESVSL